MSPETVRSFIAIHLDAGLKSQLGALQQDMHLGSAVRWTKPEQIHLTLKFLGEIPAESTQALAESLRRGCGNLAPFSLRFDSVGCFPNANKPRVIWVGLNGEIDALRELQRRVEYECVTISGRSEERDFIPHLTLGRVKEVPFKELRRIGAAIQSSKVAAPTDDWCVTQFSLMRSELTPKGAVHSELAAIELRG